VIFGIGTDIVEIGRMERALGRHGPRFATRILGPAEWDAFERAGTPATFLAKRFAAKEAAAKALGTGFRDGITLPQITVGHDPLGRPLLHFDGRAAEEAERRGVGESFISIADERRYAVAFVTLMCR